MNLVILRLARHPNLSRSGRTKTKVITVVDVGLERSRRSDSLNHAGVSRNVDVWVRQPNRVVVVANSRLLRGVWTIDRGSVVAVVAQVSRLVRVEASIAVAGSNSGVDARLRRCLEVGLSRGNRRLIEVDRIGIAGSGRVGVARTRIPRLGRLGLLRSISGHRTASTNDRSLEFGLGVFRLLQLGLSQIEFLGCVALSSRRVEIGVAVGIGVEVDARSGSIGFGFGLFGSADDRRGVVLVVAAGVGVGVGVLGDLEGSSDGRAGHVEFADDLGLLFFDLGIAGQFETGLVDLAFADDPLVAVGAEFDGLLDEGFAAFFGNGDEFGLGRF